MSHQYVVEVELREGAGKGASRRLRRLGKVPAILYGGHQEAVALTLDHNYLIHRIAEEAFHSSVLELKLPDGRTQSVVLRDAQPHPLKPQILHVDFQRVLADEVLRMMVPLHFVNEKTSPAGKKAGVVIEHQLTEIDIEALPKDLPEFIEVDLGALDVGQIIYLDDLQLPAGVQIAVLAHGGEAHVPVASASYVSEAVEPAAEEEAPPAEVPATKQTGDKE